MNIFVVLLFCIVGFLIFRIAGNATALAWFGAKWKERSDEQCVVKVAWFKKIKRIVNRIFWASFALYFLRGALGVKDVVFTTGVPSIANIDVFLLMYLLALAATLTVDVFATSSIRYYKTRFRKDPFTQQSIGPG